MEKVFKLIGSTECNALDKLILLDRLIRFYAKFLTTWKTAGAYSDGKEVCVRFQTTTKYGYVDFTERMFPIEDIDKRIRSYKDKVKREFIKRNENPRIQRAKEVYKLKKYIEDAKVQM